MSFLIWNLARGIQRPCESVEESQDVGNVPRWLDIHTFVVVQDVKRSWCLLSADAFRQHQIEEERWFSSADQNIYSFDGRCLPRSIFNTPCMPSHLHLKQIQDPLRSQQDLVQETQHGNPNDG